MTQSRSGDETWFRLLTWVKGQKSAERLALHILRAEGYTTIDPSHPLGGPDGIKDAIARRDGKVWVVAVYFPRGQKEFSAVKTKFLGDAKGVEKNQADGIVFVTNQELRLGERAELKKSACTSDVDIFHLERVAGILDTPQFYGIRLEFLDIEMSKEEQIGFFSWVQSESNQHFHSLLSESREHTALLTGLLTGGNSFCYMDIVSLDPTTHIGHFIFVNEGRFPLYNVTVRIVDVERLERAAQDSPPTSEKIEASEIVFHIGELPAKHSAIGEKINLSSVTNKRYNVFFTARNGNFHQLLRIRKHGSHWVTAKRVIRGSEVIFEQIHSKYPRNDNGEVDW